VRRPDQKQLKPMNLFESELLPYETIDIMSAAQPRYVVVYHHLSKQETEKVIQYLQEKLRIQRGAIVLPMVGRMAN